MQLTRDSPESRKDERVPSIATKPSRKRVIHGGSEVGSASKRRCLPAAASTSSPGEVIDLTAVNTERCAICANVLEEGDGRRALTYAFTYCCCVVCGKCCSNLLPKDRPQLARFVTVLRCPRYDHPELGKQGALKLYNVTCSICIENFPEKSERMDQELSVARRQARPKEPLDQLQLQERSRHRVFTRCGHSFCYGCISDWFENTDRRTCPTCESRLPKTASELSFFEIIDRGVVKRTESAIESLTSDVTDRAKSAPYQPEEDRGADVLVVCRSSKGRVEMVPTRYWGKWLAAQGI